MVQERHRLFKDFYKLEKEGKKLHEKETGTAPNRKGTLRQIRNIPLCTDTTHEKCELVKIKS